MRTSGSAIEINLFSAIAATQAAIPAMKEVGGGAIVFITSDAAFGQIRGVYGASKAAMVALARTTAREHGRHGVRSNVVCPGLVILESPEAIGASSLWAARQITGQLISVSGGYPMPWELKRTGQPTLSRDS